MEFPMRFRPLLALILVLPLMLSMAPPSGFCDAHRVPSGGHLVTDVLSDFSHPGLCNTFLRPDGMVELARSDEYYGLYENSPMIGETATYGPVAARNSLGQYIVGWVDEGGAWIQILWPDLGPKGAPLSVSPYKNRILQIAMGVGQDDRYAVMWSQSVGSYDGDYDVFLQCFAADGKRIGNVYDVTASPNFQGTPTLAVNSKGLIVMAWADERSGSRDILAQLLDFDGATIGHIIPVCNAPMNQNYPRLALFSDDDFIVVWSDYRDTGAGPVVYARLFNPVGTPVAGEFRVAQGTWRQDYPSVAALSGDYFAVSWVAKRDNTSGTDDYLHYFRCFDSAARPSTADVAAGVASDVSDRHIFSAILAGPDGGFILAMAEEHGSAWGAIRAQRFGADGRTAGSEIVASTAQSGQSVPNILGGSGTNITFIWNGGSGFHMRSFDHPLFCWGTVTVDSPMPQNLWNWTEARANIYRNGLTGDIAQINFSADGGATWNPVPANGSLYVAGNAPWLRLMVRLTTYEPQTGPILRSLTVVHLENVLPWVNVAHELSLSRHEQVSVTPEYGDEDQDPLAFRWTQAGGPASAVFDGALPQLSFRSDVPGNYSFRLIVNDGFGDSPPAFLNVTLLRTGPQPRLNVFPAVQQVLIPVLFDASNSTGPESPLVEYSFDFGDGNSTGWQGSSVVSTSYARPGQYFATLRVRDREGTEVKSPSVPVTIVGKPDQTDGTPAALRPACAVLRPADGDRVQGRIAVSGSAENGSRKLTAVEIRVDGTDWQAVSGLRAWRFPIDTRRLGNGEHVVEARAFDGTVYSETSSIRIFVYDPGVEPSVGDGGICATGVLLAVVAAAGATVVMWRRTMVGERL